MASRLRVTWLCLEWPRVGQHVGGVGRYAMRLASDLSELVDLTVVCQPDPILAPGIDFAVVPTTGGRLDRYYRASWRSRRVVAQTLPAIVHSHGDDWLLRRSTPVVRSFHGSSWSEAKASTGLRRVNHALLALTEHVSARRADLKIGVGLEASEIFGCQHVTSPFVPKSAVPPNRPAPVPTALFIGSYRGRKQGWLAERAVANLRQSIDARSRLVVVGPASDCHSWEPWVEHHGGLTDAEVLELLAESWVLLSPSSYEGFGLPSVEGLESRLAVVALSNPGSRFVRSRGSNDVPIEIVDDAEQFVASVARAVSRGPHLTNSQQEAATALVNDFAAMGSAETILGFYNSLLNSRN